MAQDERQETGEVSVCMLWNIFLTLYSRATEASSQQGSVVQLDGHDYYLQTDTEDVSVADDKSDSDV